MSRSWLAPRSQDRPPRATTIQVDLPERTLLGDVTVRHPAAKMWRKDGASARGVVAVGDQVATQKQNKYAALARDLDMAFKPLVFYTYGGFHDSTMSFIKSVTRAIDPATSLISAVEWRESLLSTLAIAVQRWTARIMIDAAQRLRSAHSLPASRRPVTVALASTAAATVTGLPRARICRAPLSFPPTPRRVRVRCAWLPTCSALPTRMTTLCAALTVSMSVLLLCALHLYIQNLYILRLFPSQTRVWMLLLARPCSYRRAP